MVPRERCGRREQQTGISYGGLGPTQVYEPGYNNIEQPALRGSGRNSHQRRLNHLYGVTKPLGQFSSSTEFQSPLALAHGDMLNFRTATTNPEVSSAVVACILEIDTN